MQVDFITALFIGTNVIKETRNVVIQKRRFIDHQYSNEDLIIIIYFYQLIIQYCSSKTFQISLAEELELCIFGSVNQYIF
jgi:hypothetical protein